MSKTNGMVDLMIGDRIRVKSPVMIANNGFNGRRIGAVRFRIVVSRRGDNDDNSVLR